MTYPNEPAFPLPKGNIDPPIDGLTKREYFAAIIMGSLMGKYPITNNTELKAVSLGAVKGADFLIETLSARDTLIDTLIEHENRNNNR